VKTVALAALALAVSASAAGAAPRSGLRGKVLIEPGYPVCRVDQPCTRPASDTVLVFTRKRRPPRRIRTSDDGSFRITLRPGSYTVAAPGEGRMRKLAPARIVVVRGRYRQLTFKLDVGIR
jgi:hypothetical protein